MSRKKLVTEFCDNNISGFETKEPIIRIPITEIKR
jgi:hypothetical protein